MVDLFSLAKLGQSFLANGLIEPRGVEVQIPSIQVYYLVGLGQFSSHQYLLDVYVTVVQGLLHPSQDNEGVPFSLQNSFILMRLLNTNFFCSYIPL
jgi:hypothetical protein